MQPMTVAEIDLSAIKENIRAIRARVGSKARIIPAVKADAYGHGAVQVSRACITAGANALGVASIDEAIELREAGIESNILILSCQLTQVVPEIVRWDVSATVCDLYFAAALSDAASRQNKTATVHVKVDTGMGRIGVQPERAVDFVRDLLALPNLHVEGVFTHFPSSDEPDYDFTRMQVSTFTKVLSGIRRLGLKGIMAHASNSGGILAFPEADFDAVRPGIIIYGAYPSRTVPKSIDVRQALTLKTRIVFLKKSESGSSVSYGRTCVLKRDSTIATLPIGYGDGYSRSLSNVGEAAVRGVRVPIAGRVCMDQTMLDVTGVPGVEVGDEVTLYGGGYDYLNISKIADTVGTIPYEVFCNIGKRVQRVYIDQRNCSRFVSTTSC